MQCNTNTSRSVSGGLSSQFGEGTNFAVGTSPVFLSNFKVTLLTSDKQRFRIEQTLRLWCFRPHHCTMDYNNHSSASLGNFSSQSKIYH